MSNKVKDIDIRNQTTTIFNEFINIKIFHPNKKLYENILINYIEYVTIKDLKFVKINNVYPLYLIFRKLNGFFEEIDKSKYLTLVPTNKNK